MIYVNDDELMHYGVIGMKWGVHRSRYAAKKGNNSKAKQIADKHYAKAEKKLNRYSQKYDRRFNKSQKQMLKSESSLYGLFGSEKRYKKATYKANKEYYKANKKLKRGLNWYRKMEKNFGKTGVHELSQQSIDIGRKFVENINTFHENAVVRRPV